MKKVQPLKEKFDPNFHEAMFEISDENLEPGTIGYVAQNGYKIGDRMLRAAKVGVVKGTPKPAATATENKDKKEEPKN